MGATASQASAYTNRNAPSPPAVMRPRVCNNDLVATPLTFNMMHGENITLSNSNCVAKRSESFCKGICFSNRPIAIGEKVVIAFREVSTNWSGVLRIGLTSVNPDTMRVATLPRYACPDLTNKTGHWAKALNERYAEQNNELFFYVTRDGTVTYGVNNQEKGPFFSGVCTTSPLWIMADIYGNTIAIEIKSGGLINQLNPVRPSAAPLQTRSSIDAPPTPTPRQPELRIVCPAIRYHANANFAPLSLSPVHGRHVTMLANRTIAYRSLDDFCQGYIFSSRPINPGEKVVTQVLATALNYFGGLCFGVTTCDPTSLCADDLPDDSDNLLDRGEYWVVNKDVCNDPSVGDELSFTYTHTGEVRYSKNNHRVATLMHVDSTLPLWFFFDLYGNLQKIRILGVTSSLGGRRSDASTSSGLSVNLPDPSNSWSTKVVMPPVWVPRQESSEEMSEQATEVVVVEDVTMSTEETLSECTVCYESRVDSVIYTCGHMCMCYKCAIVVKGTDALCPICRQEIKDVIKIYRS